MFNNWTDKYFYDVLHDSFDICIVYKVENKAESSVMINIIYNEYNNQEYKIYCIINTYCIK